MYIMDIKELRERKFPRIKEEDKGEETMDLAIKAKWKGKTKKGQREKGNMK